MELPKIKSKDFHQQITAIAANTGMSFMDAVIEWCATNGVEIEQAAEWIKKDQVLKSNIEIEAEDLHFMKRSSRLPV